jgi:hypothetical protein
LQQEGGMRRNFAQRNRRKNILIGNLSIPLSNEIPLVHSPPRFFPLHILLLILTKSQQVYPLLPCPTPASLLVSTEFLLYPSQQSLPDISQKYPPFFLHTSPLCQIGGQNWEESGIILVALCPHSSLQGQPHHPPTQAESGEEE